jgi:hypothetical protein
MPFVFGIFGVLFIVAGVRGKTSDLVALIKDDFSGQPNYFEWMIAIFMVGAIGYVDELRTISRMFLTLLILGLLFSDYRSNPALFQQFTQQETAPLQDASATAQQTSASNAFDLPTLDPEKFFNLG